MQSRHHLTRLALALALAGGAAACNPEENEGTFEELEEKVQGTELGPDTAGPGPDMGMGAGSVADTLYPPSMTEAAEVNPGPDAGPN